MHLLTNATIYTLDPRHPQASALAIRAGKVIAAGNTEDLMNTFGSGATIDDLAGAVVLPGLTDAHIHFRQYAESLQLVDCETSTLQACLQRVREKVEITPPGNWVLGHGWQQNDWPDCTSGLDGFPDAKLLDDISSNHPIYLTAKSLHASWANTAALEAADVGANTADPPDGVLQRDSSGRLTGILFEGAMRLVSQVLPRPSMQETIEMMRHAQRRLWSLGITGIHDFDRKRCFEALQAMRTTGELQLRVIKHIPVEHLDYAIGLGLRGGFGDDFLKIGSVKAFADGALGPHTAAMLAPYEDAPDNRGMLLLDREEIYEFGTRAARQGLALTIHAIGDSANHEVIEAIERLRAFEAQEGISPPRHRIEHVQLLHPADVSRLSRLGIIASMQPIHATSDMHAADKYWGDRAEYAYAWRKLLNQNTRMAFGSDAPVESPNPFWGLHAAVTRQRRDGSPGEEGWYPQERLTREEAIRGFTSGAAFAAHTENRQGMLKPGFDADLIVLEEDFFQCEAMQIAHLRPIRTMVNGAWVFEA